MQLSRARCVCVFNSGGDLLTPAPRVALFTDSFNEANGVATLSRAFAAFAQQRQYPFFCVHGGRVTQKKDDRTVTTLELKRGFSSFPLDYDLYCDPLLSRHKKWVLARTRSFRPDVIHITGPGDLGVLGFWIAHLLQVPLVASWHTNLHEYAGQRLYKMFARLPARWRERLSSAGEAQSLRACMWFYRYPRFTFAPNEAVVELLRQRTERPSFLMTHGVDTDVYSPCRRKPGNRPFCIGYVGRLAPEKNVRLLAKLEERLIAEGQHNFRIVVVGEGSEREWLGKNLRFGEFPGILRGEVLANAFADMDVFVFPSETDTFGLVLLEAMASGVPVVVSPATGARVGIQHSSGGLYAKDLNAFTESVLTLMSDVPLRQKMGGSARRFADLKRWDGVFDHLYHSYDEGLEKIGRPRRHIVAV